MKRTTILIIFIVGFLITGFSAEKVIFFGSGIEYDFEATSTLIVEGQVDLSILTLKFDLGEYSIDAKDFTRKAEPDFEIGMNIKAGSDPLYFNLQALVPLDDIISSNMENTKLNFRFGIGLKLYYFFTELGASTNLSFVSESFTSLNAYLRLGLIF